ncbi:GNAT family N-acetyltransferase [Kribbella deserti]|uniref:GNAT family N-acetyltransferase n=1 Tax=Kribbella deserti TaxID=1926257 RepID=A0ABV6QVC4_9ACTN
MTVRVTRDAEEFKTTVFAFLQRDPLLHSVLLATVQDLLNVAHGAEPDPYFFSLHGANDDVVGACLWTERKGIFLGGLTADLAVEAADAIAEVHPESILLEGLPDTAQVFVKRWSELRGVNPRELDGICLYRLNELVPHTAAGEARLAEEDDAGLCAKWVDAFRREAEPAPGTTASGHDLEGWALGRIAARQLWLWQNHGEPVSMLGHQIPVFGATRVGPVYTPPEHRNHGYASALTSHVSALLREERLEVCLRTDLSNPTSNKIYQAIGYTPVTTFTRYTLT